MQKTINLLIKKQTNEDSDSQFQVRKFYRRRQIFNQKKKTRLIKLKKKRIVPSSGKWTFSQCQAYLNFIKNNISLFASHTDRKHNRVFQKMAFTICTRTTEQCRSHHQKILKIYQNAERIAKQYEKKLQTMEKMEKKKQFQDTQNPIKRDNKSIKKTEVVGQSSKYKIVPTNMSLQITIFDENDIKGI